MGIIVPDLILDSTGVFVASAYVAVSKNNIYLQPLDGGGFLAVTSYGIWNSRPDRMDGKQPLDRRQVRANVSSLDSTFAAVYSVIYDTIKQDFPGCTDDDDHAAAPAPLDDAAPATTSTEPAT